MKQLKVYCCSFTCDTVLSTLEWDMDNPVYVSFEAVGDACPRCAIKAKNPPILDTKPTRYGEQKTEDFNALMQKRKEDNKKSGKGPPRGGRR